MSRRWMMGMLTASAVIWAGLVSGAAAAPPRDTPIEFEATDIHGQERNLADLRGDIVFINVWASWCPSCVKELPALQAFHEGHEEVHVWGVSLDMFRDAERLPEFVGKHGVTYPVINVSPEEARVFGYIEGVPMTFVIGPEGRVSGEYLGPVSRDVLENMLKSRQ